MTCVSPTSSGKACTTSSEFCAPSRSRKVEKAVHHSQRRISARLVSRSRPCTTSVSDRLAGGAMENSYGQECGCEGSAETEDQEVRAGSGDTGRRPRCGSWQPDQVPSPCPHVPAWPW